MGNVQDALYAAAVVQAAKRFVREDLKPVHAQNLNRWLSTKRILRDSVAMLEGGK